ncbi:hypothetical protein J2T02_000297 [Chitinophaga terrae (ex Kim and Jung 2007)]|uniref:AAA family ATPase n=1 Tax=Chitinophaga terrae (ex Kim and Jung 2007) TaxID=408074 RepID=UPI00278843FA|nr:AAA family ATPase [Chitinophaga terrae (ex Kim and Jung 2007)]MDQ0105214.1 hypothetical protein [Chitinophaga terrae (ex Kim and Jung 2007)]
MQIPFVFTISQPASLIGINLTDYTLNRSLETNKASTELTLLNSEVLTFDQLWDYNISEVPFLWENIIPKYSVTFLTGPSDCNKSSLLRQLACAVGQGKPNFLNIPLNLQHKSAIMVSTEDQAISCLAMLKKQFGGEYPGNVDLRFIFSCKDIPKKLEKELRKKPADLIIIDTWTDTFAKDLNQANDVRLSLHKFNDIIKRFGCTVICLHHLKKGADEKTPSKDGMIGSMGIQAFARTVIEMRLDPLQVNRRLLTIVKGNYIRNEMKNSSLLLEVEEETLILSNVGASNTLGRKVESRTFTEEQKQIFTARMHELTQNGMSQDSIVNKLKEEYPDMKTPSKGTINSWLKQSPSTSISENEKVDSHTISKDGVMTD